MSQSGTVGNEYGQNNCMHVWDSQRIHFKTVCIFFYTFSCVFWNPHQSPSSRSQLELWRPSCCLPNKSHFAYARLHPSFSLIHLYFPSPPSAPGSQLTCSETCEIATLPYSPAWGCSLPSLICSLGSGHKPNFRCGCCGQRTLVILQWSLDGWCSGIARPARKYWRAGTGEDIEMML